MKKAGLLVSFLIVAAMFSTSALAYSSDDIRITLINSVPDPANSGEIVELRFMVENLGGTEVNDLELMLDLGYPFSEVPGEVYTKTIGTLGAYQADSDAVIVKYKVRVDKDATEGPNEIRLKVGEQGSNVYIIERFNIDVKSRDFAQIIYIDRAQLNPGEQTEMGFTITNIGNAPLQNMVFSWNERNGVILPVFSDDTKYIKNLDIGESVKLDYIVVADVNTEHGLYQLNLNLEFEDADGTLTTVSTIAGVFIGGETDFDVTYSETSRGETSLSIANIGNNPALSVTVRVPEQDGFTLEGSTSSIVGNLDKGDYTIVSFKITQDDHEKDTLQVGIEYTDTTGVRHTISKDVPIRYETGGQANTGTDTTMAVVLPIAGLAIIMVVGYLVFRKRQSLPATVGRGI